MKRTARFLSSADARTMSYICFTQSPALPNQQAPFLQCVSERFKRRVFVCISPRLFSARNIPFYSLVFFFLINVKKKSKSNQFPIPSPFNPHPPPPHFSKPQIPCRSINTSEKRPETTPPPFLRPFHSASFRESLQHTLFVDLPLYSFDKTRAGRKNFFLKEKRKK